MAKTSDELLNQCLEIEGLLALVSKREDNTPPMVYEMLVSKTAELNAAVGDLCAKVGVEVVPPQESVAIADDRADEAAIGLTAEEEEMADADVDNSAFGELPAEMDLPEPMTETLDDTFEDETLEHPVMEPVAEDNMVIAESEVTAFEPVVVDYEPAVTAEHIAPVADVIEKETELVLPTIETPLELPQSESVAAVSTPESVEFEDEVQQPVLSDKFAEFTLNDKFRFRRELFGNSDIDMNEALDVVNAMSSRDEVEDYFYNDLCWDPANEDVKDFMRIVTAKFN